MRAWGLTPSFAAFSAEQDDDRGGAVADARGVAGGDGPVLAEGRPQGPQLLLVEALRLFVQGEDGLPLLAGDFHRHDLLGRGAGLLRLQRPGVAGHGEIVLLLRGKCRILPRNGRRTVPMCRLL